MTVLSPMNGCIEGMCQTADMAVDPRGASLQLRSNVQCTLTVGGPHGRTQSHVELVGLLDGPLQVRVLHNRQRRAELLLGHERVVVVQVGHEGGRVVFEGTPLRGARVVGMPSCSNSTSWICLGE